MFLNFAITPTIAVLSLIFIGMTVCFLITLLDKPGYEKELLLLIYLFGAIEIYGFLLQELATATPDYLILSRKFILLGDSVMSFMFYLFFVRFTEVKFKKWVTPLLGILTVAVAAISFSFNIVPIFYKSFEILLGPDGYYLSVVPSIVCYYYRYSAFLFLFIYALIAYKASKLNFSTRKRKQVLLLFFIPILTIITYAINLRFAKNVLSTSITLFIGDLILMYLAHSGDIYDKDNVVLEEAAKGLSTALVVLDEKGKYKGATEVAYELFPELQKITTKDKIPDNLSTLFKDILDGKATEYDTEDKTYGIYVRPTSNNCSAIWFHDITAEKKNQLIQEQYQADLEKEVEVKTKSIKDMQEHVLMSMADIIEGRDDNTGGHVKRTSNIVNMMAQEMIADGYKGASVEFLKTVSTAAPLHDIGKITISDQILLKPGKFTDEEFEIMKSHSARGADLVLTVLDGVETPATIHVTESIARSHHEKWDGTGYPEKLSGEDIPLEARIMAVADVYDALVSKRCYKDPMPFPVAHGIMEESFGTHFDPSLKKYFDKILPAVDAEYQKERDAD